MIEKTERPWKFDVFNDLFMLQKISQIFLQTCFSTFFSFWRKKAQPACIDKTNCYNPGQSKTGLLTWSSITIRKSPHHHHHTTTPYVSLQLRAIQAIQYYRVFHQERYTNLCLLNWLEGFLWPRTSGKILVWLGHFDIRLLMIL